MCLSPGATEDKVQQTPTGGGGSPPGQPQHASGALHPRQWAGVAGGPEGGDMGPFRTE